MEKKSRFTFELPKEQFEKMLELKKKYHVNFSSFFRDKLNEELNRLDGK